MYIILIFINFFYFGYLWSRNGQSFGMRLLGIKVTKRDGAQMGFLGAGLRGTVGYWISGLIFGLGFIWAAFDGNKEAWHDKILARACSRRRLWCACCVWVSSTQHATSLTIPPC